MGYSGLKNVYDSDMASGAFHVCQDAFIKQFNKEIKDKGNSYNTCGVINCCLIIEQKVMDNFDSYLIEENLRWPDLLKGINKKIEETDEKNLDTWGDESNRLFHRSAYKRMKKSLLKFLTKHKIDTNRVEEI